MTTTVAVRPLRLNTVMPVNGTSFRQEAVRRVVEGDELRIRHDTVNPHDPNACVVETLTGEQLGFVPKDLAVRLAVPHPGGRWRARVEEVFRRETWGLRVKLGPLTVEGIAERAGANDPGLRHRGDGVAEGDGVVVTTATVNEADSARDDVTNPTDGAETTPVPVFAKSGRQLGTLLEQSATHVTVLSATGGHTTYPAAVVRVG